MLPSVPSKVTLMKKKKPRKEISRREAQAKRISSPSKIVLILMKKKNMLEAEKYCSWPSQMKQIIQKKKMKIQNKQKEIWMNY